MHFLRTCALLFSFYALTASALMVKPPGPGSVDATFAPAAANNTVNSLAVQPDGQIIVGGYFTAIGSTTRNHIARVSSTGALDASFNPNADANVSYMAMQGDGAVVLTDAFTTLHSYDGGDASVRNRIARLEVFDGLFKDGLLDTTFDPNADGHVRAVALQADGKIVIGGEFSMVGGVAHSHLARLKADGSLDAAFNPVLNDYVICLLVQPDGKILVCGQFTMVNGAAHPHLVRFNADGSLDTTFNSSFDNNPHCMAIQADGRIVLGGVFTLVNGAAHNRLARLNPDGMVDPTFTPDVNNTVYTLALQTDGKILIGGDLTMVNTVARSKIARLDVNGVLDANFDPNANQWVYNITLQGDGKVLLGGGFSQVGTTTHNRLARLVNDPATQTLTVVNRGHLQWMRGGSSPEAQSVTFDLSLNSGQTWSALGAGVRIDGGWQLTGLNLPAAGEIRARARTLGGFFNGTSGLVESTATYTGAIAGLKVTTGSATNITTTSATLNAVVNPGGLASNGNIYLDGAIAGTYTFGAGTADVPVVLPIIGLAPGSTHSFYAVASNAQDNAQGTTVSFTTVPNPFNITPSAGADGAISPATVQTITTSGSLTFTATPTAGYTVDQWLVNGAAVQTGGATFALSGVTGDSTVQVTFTPITYTVTPSAGANGTVSPGAIVTELPGSSVTFTATPSDGFVVDLWLVNGAVAQTGGPTFTLNNVAGAGTVSVTFKPLPQILVSKTPDNKPQPKVAGYYASDDSFAGVVHFRREAGKIVGIDTAVLTSPSSQGAMELAFDESGRPIQMTTSDGVSLAFHYKPDGRIKVVGNDAAGVPIKAKVSGFESTLPAAAAALMAVAPELQNTDFSQPISSAYPLPGKHAMEAFGRTNSPYAHLFGNVCRVAAIIGDVVLAADPLTPGLGTVFFGAKAVAGLIDLYKFNKGEDSPRLTEMVVAADFAESFPKAQAFQKLIKGGVEHSADVGGLLRDLAVVVADEYERHHEPHLVTAEALPNGTVGPIAVSDIPYMGTATFKAKPNPGYVVDDWLVDDVPGYGDDSPDGSGRSTSFTLTEIVGDHRVKVSFKPPLASFTLNGDIPVQTVNILDGSGNSIPATVSGSIQIYYDQYAQEYGGGVYWTLTSSAYSSHYGGKFHLPGAPPKQISATIAAGGRNDGSMADLLKLTNSGYGFAGTVKLSSYWATGGGTDLGTVLGGGAGTPTHTGIAVTTHSVLVNVFGN